MDLSTAEAVLRAESDENTCRKSLTPYEASRARKRRAAVLAPPAAERERAGVKQPSPNLGEGSRKAPRKARETAKVAAIGTGYSGTTLDKVDKVRAIAEKGEIRQGGTVVTAPEPVREVARAALADLQREGASVDGASRGPNGRPPKPANRLTPPAAAVS